MFGEMAQWHGCRGLAGPCLLGPTKAKRRSRAAPKALRADAADAAQRVCQYLQP